LVFLHGVGASLHTWDPVLPAFVAGHQVVAPDLIGYGASDKPRMDYGPSSLANSVRDLLTVLNISRATLVGHSFGGGVAMQFAYQFPQFVERVVLVSSGGLGREVTPFLRLATLPGSARALAAIQLPGVRQGVARTARMVARVPDLGSLRSSILDLLDIYESLHTPAARRAFQATLRTTMYSRGQTLSMLDRAYVTSMIPTMLVWGRRDLILPVHHAYAGHEAMPGSRLEIFPRSGHCPHRQDPKRFVAAVEDFMATTPAARFDARKWRRLIRATAIDKAPNAEGAAPPRTSTPRPRRSRPRPSTQPGKLGSDR
jgi:pimeloyl-ACP methyl ester carboxylesterase